MRAISLVFILFWFSINFAVASPTNPVEGAEYKTLGVPQPVTAKGKQIEVIEFFMYHCPACNMLEPQLQQWVSKQGSNIVFRRIHLPHNGENDVEAHLFLTLEALQMEDAMHARVLHYWHVEHRQLLSDQDNIDWAVKNGIGKSQFLEAYNSFSVISRLHNLLRLAGNYQVSSTPTLVIDGRYVTGPGLIQDSNRAIPVEGLDKAMLQVADALVEKARASK